MPKVDIPFETLIADLHGPDWDKRCDAARLLGLSRDPRAVDALLPDLADPDWKVRRNAAQALGALKDPRGVDGLLGALKDRTATVRERAAVGLGRIKDPKTLPALLAALVEESGHVNQGANGAVKKFGQKAGPYLAEALAAKPNIYLLDLLAQCKYEGALDIFIKLAGSPDPVVRKRALAAVGSVNDPAAINYLLDALAHGEVESKIIAVRCLGRLGAAQAVPTMLDLLEDPALHGPMAELPHAITEAFQDLSGIKQDLQAAFPGKIPALFSMMGRPANLPEAMGLLGDENFKKLNQMLADMESRAEDLGDEQKLPPGAVKSVSDQTWKFGAIFADARDARAEHVKVLTGLLKSGSPLARAAAALSLPWYMDPDSQSQLEAAAQDPDETVRRAAAWALAAMHKDLGFRG